jgi:hypothetical protein
MTHEDLISDLTSLHFRGSRTPDVPYHALLAVAMLHKPEFWPSLNVSYCEGCKDQLYPCPTIDVIEEELA